jgi:hypothetical protein
LTLNPDKQPHAMETPLISDDELPVAQDLFGIHPVENPEEYRCPNRHDDGNTELEEI